MFERFTERARHAVVLAQEAARELRHGYIGTEHILLGLCREEEGVAGRALEALGITAERVRAEVVRTVGMGAEAVQGQMPFRPRSKKVLELALREALALRHDYIGTEHLLLGLLREGDSVAVQVLTDLGGDPTVIRERVIETLPPPDPTAPPPPAMREIARGVRRAERRRPILDWERATMLWRPEGLELRIPIHLDEGALAAFATDAVWTQEPLVGMRREIWNGWLALASPTLLEDADPTALRRMLDAAAARTRDVRSREQGRVADFLRRLRDPPPATG
jgi:hypothetical protein